MMKEEFEKIVGETVSNEDYNVIEKVYIWHPSISEVSGKDQISSIYRQFGMPVIHDMLDKLFTKSQNPQEWELAKAFLCDKYGKEIADFVIKEMD